MPHTARQVGRDLATGGLFVAASTGTSPNGDLQASHAALSRTVGIGAAPMNGITVSDENGLGERARVAADRRADADDREVVSGMPEWMICAATRAGVDFGGSRSCRG